MRTIVAFGLITVLAYLPVMADEEAKPEIFSALDLKQGNAVVLGLLRKPLGTSQVIAGSGVEPPNKEKINNPLWVAETDGIQWGAGVPIEIRNVFIEKDKHYRLEGFESGEFVGADKDNPEAPPLHYNPFFVVTKVLDLEKSAKVIRPADIKITFAERQSELPIGIPKDASNEKLDDASDAGALSKIVARDIAGLRVTAYDRKRFKSERTVTDFLRQLLTVKQGSTWKYQAWSQGIDPMLVVSVEHSNGNIGKWYIAPNGENNVLSVYQDGAGKWWFSSWQNLIVPKAASATSGRASMSVESFRFIDAATTWEQILAKVGEPDSSGAGGFYDIHTYCLDDGSKVTIGSGDGKVLFVAHGKDTLFGHTMFEKK